MQLFKIAIIISKSNFSSLNLSLSHFPPPAPVCGRWHYEVSSRGLYISTSVALLPVTNTDSISGQFHSATMSFLCSGHLQHSAVAHGGVGLTVRVSRISLLRFQFPGLRDFLHYPGASPHDLTPLAFYELRKHLLNNARFCHQLKMRAGPFDNGCQDG